MAMQIRCRCGANLVVDPGTTTIVCAACQATIAVPQPERELALSETIPAFEAQAAIKMAANATVETGPVPAPPKKRSTWPIIAGALAVVGAGIALVVVATRSDDKPKTEDKQVVVPAKTLDAAAPEAPPAQATSPEELVVLERAAIAKADEAALVALMMPNAFVHGIDASDVAYSAKLGAPFVRSIGGTLVESTWSKITRDKDVAWIVDELNAGGLKVLTSQLAVRDGTTWKVAAWHVAQLVPNKVAYEQARARRLPTPDAVTDQPDDDHQVHDAFLAAFSSREAFITAFSERADAIDLGSAPGERILGGPAVKKAFGKIAAIISVQPGVAAGRAGDKVGWAAGNVSFTMTIDDEDTTQIFRVLAVLVREKDGWRIVLAQWSNAGPIKI